MLKFVDSTSNWWAQMCENQKSTKLLHMLISNLPDLYQSLSLEFTRVDNAVPCFPHGNIDGSHVYDECRKSIWPNVCHKLESTLWLIGQVCWLSIECLVYQFWPNTNILRQFVSILLTILPPISILLLLWIDGHQCMALIPCEVVEPSCLPTHNIVPHISWHDLPCHKTTKKYADFSSMVVCQLLVFLFANSQHLSTHFWACPSI